MKKTCFNCKYFCNTLSDPDQPSYHIHYWCKYWRTCLDRSCGLADRYEYKTSYFDDLETGEAYCYMFSLRELPMYEDAWFEHNQAENIKNRISEVDE